MLTENILKNDIDWDELAALAEKLHIVCAFDSINSVAPCKERKIKYFWSYPISSYYELRGILNQGVSAVLLDAPLYFDLPQVRDVCGEDIEIRLIANVCYDRYIPRADGINGTYVRPEDVEAYDAWVDLLEFRCSSLKQEHALLEIYALKKEWPGNLNLLLTNFGFNVDNRALPVEFGLTRMNCRQTCMRTGTCHWCRTAVQFSRVLDRNKHKFFDTDLPPEESEN